MQNILIDSFENAVNEFKKAIPENIFNHFIAVLVPIRDENNILYVLSPSEMVKDEIDNNFLDKFNSLISKYSASDAKIEIVTSELSIPKSTKANINLNIASTKLNNSLTFSNYIISKFNEFPVKAVKHASKKHKCILISGYVGTGKTHLLNACGWNYIEKNNNDSVLYIRSDDLKREIWDNMKEPAKLEELKRQYFKPEMLLIDDIQTFIDKPKIGDVFFDIFNYRNDHDKITVMTSDIHVDELRKINERVTSRLASGLVTQILPPDPSSIKEIINIKTSTWTEGYRLSNDAINYLVARNNGDLRRLCSQLDNIYFFCATDYDSETLITKDIIEKIVVTNKNKVNVDLLNVNCDFIIENICDQYHINIDAVKGKSRNSQIVNVRNICIYILYQKKLTYVKIGRIFNKTHASIIHSIETVKKHLSKNPELETLIGAFSKI